MPTADVAQYAEVLNEEQFAGMVDHFPKVIPASANQVRFSHLHSALQGGQWVQLHLQLPTEEVAAIDGDAQKRAVQTWPGGGNSCSPLNASPKGKCPAANYHTAPIITPRAPRYEDFSTDFPSTFTTYTFNAVDKGFGTWDPSSTYGISVSISTNEVVYWAEH